ncbi:MAG TPA: hypothetical protein VIJ31_11565 [Acidothermaceae bacterium]
MPEAVLLGAAALLAGAGGVLLAAGAVLLGAALTGAGAELGAADDAPAAGALEAGAEVCLELEQPANANAATTTGSQIRCCIFTACSLTGSIENRGQRLRRHHVTGRRVLSSSRTMDNVRIGDRRE